MLTNWYHMSLLRAIHLSSQLNCRIVPHNQSVFIGTITLVSLAFNVNKVSNICFKKSTDERSCQKASFGQSVSSLVPHWQLVYTVWPNLRCTSTLLCDGAQQTVVELDSLIVSSMVFWSGHLTATWAIIGLTTCIRSKFWRSSQCRENLLNDHIIATLDGNKIGYWRGLAFLILERITYTCDTELRNWTWTIQAIRSSSVGRLMESTDRCRWYCNDGTMTLS